MTGDNTIEIRRTTLNGGYIQFDAICLEARQPLNTDEDTVLTVDATEGLLSNDSDPDANDVITVIDSDTTTTGGGTVTVNSDGSFEYDPNGQFEDLMAGKTATDTFNYTIASGVGYSQDFDGFADGSTDFGDGSSIATNNAAVTVTQGGALRLTSDATGNTVSGFHTPPVAGTSQGFVARFEATLSDAAGGNGPADGFSFNVGDFPPSNGGRETGMDGGNESTNLRV